MNIFKKFSLVIGLFFIISFLLIPNNVTFAYQDSFYISDNFPSVIRFVEGTETVPDETHFFSGDAFNVSGVIETDGSPLSIGSTYVSMKAMLFHVDNGGNQTMISPQQMVINSTSLNFLEIPYDSVSGNTTFTIPAVYGHAIVQITVEAFGKTDVYTKDFYIHNPSEIVVNAWATPSTISPGYTSVVHWSADPTVGVACSTSEGDPIATSGYFTTDPLDTTSSYGFTCNNGNQANLISGSAIATVNVAYPTVTASATTPISSGSSSVISYQSTSSNSCDISKLDSIGGSPVVIAKHCPTSGFYYTDELTNSGNSNIITHYKVECGVGPYYNNTSPEGDCNGPGGEGLAYNENNTNKTEKKLAFFWGEVKNILSNLIPKISADVSIPAYVESKDLYITVTPAPTVTLDYAPSNKKDLVDADNPAVNGTSHFIATISGLSSGQSCGLRNITVEPNTDIGSSFTNGNHSRDISSIPSGTNLFKLVCTGGTTSNTVSVNGQSGALSAESSYCVIPTGGSSCTVNTTWNTINPQTGVTTWFVGGTPATAGNDGSGVLVTINGSGIINTGSNSGSTTLATYNKVDGENNGASVDNQLASLPISVSCAGGNWDGAKCTVNTILISPDLVAGSPDWSGSAWAGQSKSVSSVITNSGQATTGSTVFYNLFQLGKTTATGGSGSISYSNSNKNSILASIIKKIKKVDAAENLAYTVIDNFVSSNSMSNLDVGASSVAYGTITFPSEAGTYYVRACADKNSQASTGVIAESNEGNNCSAWVEVTTTTPTVLKSNLTASNPSLSAGLAGSGSSTLNVVLNKSTKFYSTIVNNGSASTGGSFNNSFQVRTSSLGTPTSYTADPNPMTTLSAGATSTASKSITFSSAGNYEIRACADIPPANPGTISELNENDNCSAWVTIVVGTGATLLPDLRISDIAPSSVPVGVSTTFYANISNEGGASAVSSNGKGFYNLLQWYSASDPLGTIHDVTGSDMTATPLAVGEIAVFSRSIKFSELGSYMVRACADKSSSSDVSGLVAESNENNNCSNNWAKILVEESVSPSGSITANGCDIGLDESKCDANLSWVTYNPVSVSAVTTPTNITVAEGNSGEATYPVEHGSRDFYLYHNGILLGSDSAVAKCVSGTIWDGNVCIKDTGSSLNGKCSTEEFKCLQGTVENIEYGTDGYNYWQCRGDNNTVDSCSYYVGGTGGVITTGEVTLTAVPSWIFRGRYSTLSWTSWAGATCALVDSNGNPITTDTDISGNGHMDVNPTSTTTYTMTCANSGGAESAEANSSSASATVRVIRPIIFER